MKIIGLTGGIGSGKSTVLQFFKELGAVTYIADIEAKKIMNNDAELIHQIKLIFGEMAYVNNVLNTEYLAEIVFNNAEKLKQLNSLVHPKVRKNFKEFTQKIKAEIVIYEAAILFESGSDQLCDYIITVTTAIDERIKRIIQRDKVSKKAVLKRIQFQLNDEIKIKKAHFVIRNNNLTATKSQVKTVYNLILA